MKPRPRKRYTRPRVAAAEVVLKYETSISGEDCQVDAKVRRADAAALKSARIRPWIRQN